MGSNWEGDSCSERKNTVKNQIFGKLRRWRMRFGMGFEQICLHFDFLVCYSRSNFEWLGATQNDP